MKPNDSKRAIVVLCTAPPSAAEELARRLVQAKLAACVQQVPGIRSTYRWKGELQVDEEALLVIKTTRGSFEALRSTLSDWHPYDIPEILALDVEAGHVPYLEWVAAEVGDGGS